MPLSVRNAVLLLYGDAAESRGAPGRAVRETRIQSLGERGTCSVACCRRDYERLVRRGCTSGALRHPGGGRADPRRPALADDMLRGLPTSIGWRSLSRMEFRPVESVGLVRF